MANDFRAVKYEIFDPTNSMHLECAEVLDTWRQIHHDRETAKAISADDVVAAMLPLNLDEHAIGLMAFESHGDEDSPNPENLRSYNAVRDIYPADEAIEIGGLITEPSDSSGKIDPNEEMRKKGWAWAVKPELYRLIGERWPGWRMIIFANAKSLRMNLKMGFSPVESTLPVAAIEACTSCPNFVKLQIGRTCCDTHIELYATPDNLRRASEFAVYSAKRYGILA